MKTLEFKFYLEAWRWARNAHITKYSLKKLSDGYTATWQLTF